MNANMTNKEFPLQRAWLEYDDYDRATKYRAEYKGLQTWRIYQCAHNGWYYCADIKARSTISTDDLFDLYFESEKHNERDRCEE